MYTSTEKDWVKLDMRTAAIEKISIDSIQSDAWQNVPLYVESRMTADD